MTLTAPLTANWYRGKRVRRYNKKKQFKRNGTCQFVPENTLSTARHLH